MSQFFDELYERRKTGAIKWDALKTIYGTEDILPMWVADMDFSSPPGVQEALLNRAQHPIFGYTSLSDKAVEAITDWVLYRHQWKVQHESILFCPGVVTGIATVIQACTEPGDKVMLQSPVYTPFFTMIKNNGREVVNSPLLVENNQFSIDFKVFEDKLKQGVKLFLLCSPHNPGGRVWTKEELLKIGELCKKYEVTIVSDEIHADLYFPGHKHVPAASINPDLENQTITLMAPSKTFNIAGLQASFMVVSNPELRKKISAVQGAIGFHGLNLFAITALEAAYREGADWLNELLTYIEENVRITQAFIETEIPALNVFKPEASYLVWIDCRTLGHNDKEIQRLLVEKGKLGLEPGNKYGQGGEGFVRMNIGCPREVLMDGLNRLKKAFT
ncbi:MalY/PatB family protein [Bacillus massiliglaciei]|uniref:MalY/PatB family protein n=1 Tax=Bacillus massiliglaciei TaxID=1816693 RepID=UPI000B2E41B8